MGACDDRWACGEGSAVSFAHDPCRLRPNGRAAQCRRCAGARIFAADGVVKDCLPARLCANQITGLCGLGLCDVDSGCGRDPWAKHTATPIRPNRQQGLAGAGLRWESEAVQIV